MPPGRDEYRVQSYEDGEIKPIIPWDETPPEPDAGVKRVVFVFHGIRDEGHWTQMIPNRARNIFKRERQGKTEQIALETKGTRGAAIEESNRDQLARFAVSDFIPSEDTLHYWKEPYFLFRTGWGWVTCVDAWVCALTLGLFWLPLAAWASPVGFWGMGLTALLTAYLVVAILHPLSRSGPLRRRKRIRKIFFVVLIAAAAAVLVSWIRWPFCFQVLDTSWANEFQSAPLQTLSVSAYVAMLWTVLTKV